MMDDLISRQAAIDALEKEKPTPFINKDGSIDPFGAGRQNQWYRDGIAIMNLPPAQPEQKWIPTSEKLPDELDEVNVTWENTEPEPYYDFVKGHYFTGTAVYFRGKWHWSSAVCVDYLREYGFSPSDEMDDAIMVRAWMPLPEPYIERRTDG